MKNKVLRLIPEKYLPDTVVDGVIVKKVATAYVDLTHPEALKVWRGFNHAVTARLLCPTKHIEQFKRDPDGYVGCLICHIHVLITKRRTQQDLKHRRLRLIDRCASYSRGPSDEGKSRGESSRWGGLSLPWSRGFGVVE